MRISDWSSDVCSSDLFEAVDEGTIADIAIPEGPDGVKVGTVIALLVAEGEDVSAPKEKSPARRSEEHTSETQSLMRNSYAVFCLKKKIAPKTHSCINHYTPLSL